MRRVFGAVVTAWLALLGCASHYEQVEEAYSPALLESLMRGPSFTVFRDDGVSTFMYQVQDFGPYICDDAHCVAKADIARIRYLQQSPDAGGTARNALLAPLAIPFLVIGTAASMGEHGNGPDLPALRDLPPEKRARLWLDGYHVIMGGSLVRDPERNGCSFERSPARVAQEFSSDSEAAAWLWPHRFELSAACLNSASELFVMSDRAKALELWTMGKARKAWENGRCRISDAREELSLPSVQITPPRWTDLSAQHGDPAVFTTIRAIIADPRVFDYQPDMAAICGMRQLAPESQWPQVRDYVLSLQPPAAPD